MHEEEKFSDLSLKDKTIIISIIALFLIIIFAFIFFVYVGIFQITGIEYSSRIALLLFFLLITFLDADGKNIYQRAGFQPIGEMVVFE
ncbi:hypothetical protein GPJ55_24265 [Bacillus subtilis]|nr:hypothetical protein GPJ55_24265 [Bacillus subtilis]